MPVYIPISIDQIRIITNQIGYGYHSIARNYMSNYVNYIPNMGISHIANSQYPQQFQRITHWYRVCLNCA